LPKVKMLQSMAGLNFSLVAGDVLEVRDDVAIAWINGGVAVLVEEEKPKKKTALKKGDDK
jgi:hypothetical protein